MCAIRLYIRYGEAVGRIAVALAEYGLQRRGFVGMHGQVQVHGAVAAVGGLQVQRVDAARLLVRQVEAVLRIAVAGADGGFEIGLFVRVHRQMQCHHAVTAIAALQLYRIAAVALHVEDVETILCVAAALHHAGIKLRVIRLMHRQAQYYRAVAALRCGKLLFVSLACFSIRYRKTILQIAFTLA